MWIIGIYRVVGHIDLDFCARNLVGLMPQPLTAQAIRIQSSRILFENATIRNHTPTLIQQ